MPLGNRRWMLLRCTSLRPPPSSPPEMWRISVTLFHCQPTIACTTESGNTVVDIESANTVAIHFESLRGGLRLPLHPFIRRSLISHNLAARQLTPNTYSLIVAYIIRRGSLVASTHPQVFYLMYQLTPLKENKEELGYYYFNANVKGKKAVKYGVVRTRSNVKNWKVKFILVTTKQLGVSTRRQEIYPKPPRRMRSYLENRRDGTSGHVHYRGKKYFEQWFEVITLENLEKFRIATCAHPLFRACMANIFKRVVNILGPPGNAVVKEVLSDGVESSSSPSELRGVTAEPPPAKEEGGSSSAPQQKATPPAPREEPLRPSSPRFKIMYGKRGEATPPGSAEEKSADSQRPAPRKRTRAQTKAVATTGGEDEIIDFTTAVKTSHKSMTPPQGRGRRRSTRRTRWETAEEPVWATDTEPPKKKPKRTLKKNGAAVSVATHAEVAPQEKAIIVAPSKDKGKGITDPTPRLDLPPQLHPIDPVSTQSPQTIAYSSPQWKVMPHHSIIVPGPDKKAHEDLRLDWARGAMTKKDVEIATGLSDQKASEKEVALARQRAKAAEEKEQKALDALKHKEKQMAAMELNFTKSHNECKNERARAERALEEIKVRDNTISYMADDAKQMKKKYEVLERKYATLKEAEKRQRDLVKQQEEEIQFLRDAEAKHAQQMLDANMEEIKLRALVRYNRTKRQELRTALTAYVADAEAMAVDKYIKTSDYENAMGDICCDFYKFGFDLARLQREGDRQGRKVEVPDALDMKDTSGPEIPQEIPFPQQWLPKRVSTRDLLRATTGMGGTAGTTSMLHRPLLLSHMWIVLSARGCTVLLLAKGPLKYDHSCLKTLISCL
ncbi:hypothetical protein Dimus_020299 [Dionaea muscipula]